MNTTTLPNEKYGFLLSKYQPRPIRSESDYEEALEAIEELIFKGGERSSEETALLQVLGALVEEYEESQVPEETSSPLEVLKFLMEVNELKQSDLVGWLGSKGVVSEILNGKRAISKTQAKALGEKFNVSPGLFI